MRIILYCFIFLLVKMNYAQSNKDEIIYEGDLVYYVILDSNGEELSKKVVGKEPTILYDKVFQIYKISYEDRNYDLTNKSFEVYGNKTEDGYLKLRNTNWRSADSYLGKNEITLKNQLSICDYGWHTVDESKETLGCYLFTNLKRKR